MTRRLFATLPGPEGKFYEQGRHLQETVAGRLYLKKKLGRGNVLSEDCKFKDIRGCIIDCFLPPFLDNRGAEVPAEEGTGNVVLQMGGLMKEHFEQVKELKSAPPTPAVFRPTKLRPVPEDIRMDTNAGVVLAINPLERGAVSGRRLFVHTFLVIRELKQSEIRGKFREELVSFYGNAREVFIS